ncbi:hypothetical protein [Maribacter sp. ACAM166]|nr:hypothetical protein [Maribacter sp. ACAM166]
MTCNDWIDVHKYLFYRGYIVNPEVMLIFMDIYGYLWVLYRGNMRL